MKSASHTPAARPRGERIARPGSILPALALILALAGLGVVTFAVLRLDRSVRDLDDRVSTLTETNDRLDRTIDLMRIEQEAEGAGTEALIERIGHYAPQLTKAITIELPVIKERLEETMQALELLGRDAFDDLLAAFEEEKDDTTRSWLLHAMLRVHPERGKQVAAPLIRGTRYSPSPRMRNLAADQLIHVDHEYAGKVLEELLLMTSARGALRKRVPPELREEYLDIPLGATQTPTFHTFVTKYIKCDPPNLARTLHQIIGREEHDRVTIQTCVKELGKQEHRPAVPRIKELYEHPPGPIDDPVFKTNCLRALGNILGPDGCDFFQEEMVTQQNPTVRATLGDLIKTHCGSPSK